MSTYCTQCGLKGRPVAATGTDQDGEPACIGHAVKGTVTITATAVREFCACGREKGHRGRHKGNMVPVQMDEGFLDDMIGMAEPEEKAIMLDVAWRTRK